MKFTGLLALLMKKRAKEPTLRFEVAFQHERATIRTAVGEVFDDWPSVSDRWCIEYPSGYRALPPSYELLYLVEPDRLLQVQVSSGALTETVDGQRLIQGFTEPNAFFVTARRGLELLTTWGHKVPDTIKRLAEAEENVIRERDAQPARPLELWQDLPQFTEITSVPRNRDAYVHLAQIYAISATSLFDTLERWRSKGLVYDSDAHSCARVFLKRFRPDARSWLMEKKSPPPASLGVAELAWPSDLQEARNIIVQLQSRIALPLVSTIAGQILDESHDVVPNAAERNRGIEILNGATGEIARLTGTLSEFVQQSRLKTYEAEPSPSLPAETVEAGNDAVAVPITPDMAPSPVLGSVASSSQTEQEPQYRRCVMERTANGWAFLFRGAKYSFANSLGLACIHILLKAGKSIDAIDLDAEARLQPSIRSGCAGENLDRTAISQLKERLTDIEEEIADARQLGGESALESLMTEKERIESQLTSDLSVRGRSRTGYAEQENARQRVTKNLRAAYVKIAAQCQDLASHLESNIETGAIVRFIGHPDFPWETF